MGNCRRWRLPDDAVRNWRTAVQENVDVNIAIINNRFLGMVRQWQEFFYEERYNATPMFNARFRQAGRSLRHSGHARYVARADGRIGQRLRAATKGPALIEYVVEKEEIVYPMVPAGADLHNMIRRPKPGEEK